MKNKMTTRKQVVANRRNAQKSTGPITRGGKNHSKRNSLKHGLLSREVVIRSGDGKEDETDYKDLLSRVINKQMEASPYRLHCKMEASILGLSA